MGPAAGEAVGQIAPDRAAGSFACPDPHMGPVRRATGKLLLLHRPTSDPLLQAFQPVQSLVTRAIYIPSRQHREPFGYFDHSAAGMDAHADAWWQFYQTRRAAGDGSVLWWDPEQGTSRNVPPSVDYNRARDRASAAVYRYHADARLRLEAVRWQAGMASRLIARADAAGATDFEMSQYDLPNRPVIGDEDSDWVYRRQVDEVRAALLCPYFAFGGPGAYFAGTQSMISNWTAAQHVARTVEVMTRVRALFGPGQKIVPAIWARWYIRPTFLDRWIPGRSPVYPNDDIVVPPGYLRAMVKALLDAGVDGVVVWRGTPDDADPAAAARMAERYQEVVEVVRAHGGFQAA
ncbi:MAG: hypothetical protein ACJ8H8_11965 [Geminicoccaceae bacterium]